MNWNNKLSRLKIASAHRVMHGLAHRAVSCAALLAALAGFAAIAPSARAQSSGSRKDDVVLNARGLPLAGAQIRVCASTASAPPCTPLALIYSDEALTQALANPTTTDGMGNYSFYTAPGRYVIEVSGPGITTRQLRDVILPNDPSAPTFTTINTTSGISAFSLTLAGNLAVAGSAAITGGLTVNGGPVPSTASANTWTGSQNFGGPVPWRDCTAYGYVGNGSHDDGPAINSCIAAAESDPGGTVYIPWTAGGGFINTCLVVAATHTQWLTIKIAAPVLQWGSGCTTQNFHTNSLQIEGLGASGLTAGDGFNAKAGLRNYAFSSAPFIDIFGSSVILKNLNISCGATIGSSVCVNVDNNGTGSSANVYLMGTNVGSSSVGPALQFSGLNPPGGFEGYVKEGVFTSASGCNASVKIVNWGGVFLEDDFVTTCGIYVQYVHGSAAPVTQILVKNLFVEALTGAVVTLDSDTTAGSGITLVEIDNVLQADNLSGANVLVKTTGTNSIQGVTIRNASGASPSVVNQSANPINGLNLTGTQADSSTYLTGSYGQSFNGPASWFWSGSPTAQAVGTVRGGMILCNGSFTPGADAPLHVIDCTNGGNGMSFSVFSPGLVQRLDSAYGNPITTREFPANGTWTDEFNPVSGFGATVSLNSLYGIWTSQISNGVAGNVSGQDIGGFAKGFSTTNDLAFERNGGTSRILLTGAPTANRIVTFPDSSGTIELALSGTTSSIGGSSLSAGACTTGTASVSGATTSMAVAASPVADPGTGFTWNAFVSAAGAVTVRVCNVSGSSATPTAAAYNVRVIQ